MGILVTGRAGFMGGHLAEPFIAHGHEVVVLDNLTPITIRGSRTTPSKSAANALTRATEPIDSSKAMSEMPISLLT